MFTDFNPATAKKLEDDYTTTGSRYIYRKSMGLLILQMSY